jgi:tRNA modification GTPase
VNGAGGTIVASATAASAGARGVVRISGPEAIAAAEVCSTVAPRAGVARVTVRTSLGEVPALALVSRAPASFTGEDSVEFAAAGHPAILEAIAAALRAHPGVRPAVAGEFTARAHLARDGLGASARRGADLLSEVLAGIEAGIDFTDEEDVVPVPPARLAAALDEVEAVVQKEIAPRAARIEGRGRRPVAALVGPANAGKSSLFNALLGRERSVTGPVRGTTRDAIVEELDLRHHGRTVRLALVDLAGEGGSPDPLDAAAGRRRDAAVSEADLLVRCVPPGETSAPPGPRTIVVATKSDLAPVADGVLATSVRTGAGLDELRAVLAERAAAIVPRESVVDAVTRRHVEALERTRAALARARELVPRLRRQPELVAAAVAEAIAPLRELTGVGTPDEVLGRIFARFCIGK